MSVMTILDVTNAQVAQHVGNCEKCGKTREKYELLTMGEHEIKTLKAAIQCLHIRNEYEATLSNTAKKLLPDVEKLADDYAQKYSYEKRIAFDNMAECALKTGLPATAKV